MSVRPPVCVEEFGSSLSQPASRLIAMMAQDVGAVEKQVAGRGTGQCPPASMWPGPACNAQGLSGWKDRDGKKTELSEMHYACTWFALRMIHSPIYLC